MLDFEMLKSIDKVLSEIKYERARQITEGYGHPHEDGEPAENIPRAAVYYTLFALHRYDRGKGDYLLFPSEPEDRQETGYPWEEWADKIEVNRRDNLVKAAALIIGEIEQINRKRVYQ